MIKIKFERQKLTNREIEKYARIIKKIIKQISNLNKDVACEELKIIFK